MITIVVEIPHRLPPTAWVAESDQKLIEIAGSVHGLVYEMWDKEKARDCYDDSEIPKSLSGLLDLCGSALEIGHSGETEFFNPDEAVGEIEAAKDAISHDLFICGFLTADEAKKFVSEYSGHQYPAARVAVARALADI